MQPIDLFYTLSREHKRLNSFVYGKAYEKGAGNNKYPLAWLDDPVTGNTAGPQPSAPLAQIQWICNVDFLGIPNNDADVINVQAAAFAVGLSFAEQINKTRHVNKYFAAGFNFISLREYYDDNAAGYRFTFTLQEANPVDLCADDFDPAKVFTDISPLPAFNTIASEGCAVFTDKPGLPNFSVTP